jgi:hypothetical protein
LDKRGNENLLAKLFTDPAWVAVSLTALGLLLTAAGYAARYWKRKSRRAPRIKRSISDFLEILHRRNIWKEGEGHREIAHPEKMSESVEFIRTKLTDVIVNLSHDNYENLKLLTDIQEACLKLSDNLDRNHRRLEQEPKFGKTEFFDAVYPQLLEFQHVLVERCRSLCEDQDLCGESPCRDFC